MEKKRISIDIDVDLYRKLQFDSLCVDTVVKKHIESIVEKVAKKVPARNVGNFSSLISNQVQYKK